VRPDGESATPVPSVPGMSNRVKILIGVAVVVVVAVGGGLWWWLGDDAPDAVSLDAAVDQVEGDEPAATSTPAGNAGPSAIDGTWTVDTETGEFDFDSATGTFAGYRVEEELAGIGANTAVGRTGDVTGSVTIDGSTVDEAQFEVDLTTLASDEGLRDGQAQGALETSLFPTTTFVLTEPIDLPGEAASGEAVSLTAMGDLTLHGVTRSVEFPLEAQLVEDTVVLVGSVEVIFADYDVEVPTTPIALSVDQEGILELQILLTRS